MDRYLDSGGSASPPAPVAGPIIDRFWSNSSKVTAYFLHVVTESLRNVIVAAGLTPNHLNINLLSDAILRLGNGYDQFFIGGPPPERDSNSAATIRMGTIAVDVTTRELMKVTGADLTVALTASGVNGLDTGAEANSTWYYLWLIKNPTNGLVRGLLSASATSPTMPAGYTHKRLLPMPLRNGSDGHLVPQRHIGGYPEAATWKYDTGHSNAIDLTARTRVIAGALSESAWETYSCAAFVPTIARHADFQVRVNQTGTISFRRPGTTHQGDGLFFPSVNALGDYDAMLLSPTQTIEMQTAIGAGGSVDVEIYQYMCDYPTV